MLKNYLKTAIRNLVRFKTYSLLNIVGLIIGFTSCFLILLFVQDELSYDKYNRNAEQIYRLTEDMVSGGKIWHSAESAAPIGPALLNEYPAVKSLVRFYKYPLKAVINYGEKNFFESNFLFADSSVFDVFTWHLLEGNPETALSEPYTVVITKTMATKYFGNEDPIGKTLTLNHWKTFRVTGVVQDIPHNSHFTFDFLASFVTLKSFMFQGQLDNWGAVDFYTYLMLLKNSSPQELGKQLPQFIDRHMNVAGYECVPHLGSLISIHLYSHLEHEIAPQGDIAYIRVFFAIAILVLLIACINFVNTSTARSTTRVREVGLRKAVGAHRSQLIGQFVGESVVLSSIALVCSLGLTEFFLPVLNFVTGKNP